MRKMMYLDSAQSLQLTSQGVVISSPALDFQIGRRQNSAGGHRTVEDRYEAAEADRPQGSSPSLSKIQPLRSASHRLVVARLFRR